MIKKPTLSIDHAYEDFGFSAVSEDELKQKEFELKQELNSTSETLEKVATTYEAKLQQLYQLIMPLLHNLKKNPEKEYIYWPNRAEKVEEFIGKVSKIIDD